MGMVAVSWPDGTFNLSHSWDELEDLVRSQQWDSYSAEGFRAEMEARALNWSGTDIRTDGTSEDFFREMERAHLLTIVPVTTISISQATKGY